MSGFKDQLLGDTLFDVHALARANDPKTSHDAADHVKARRLGEVLRVLSLPRFIQMGATKDEVFEHLRATDPTIERDTVSPRFKPLRKLGLVELRYGSDGKELTRTERSGRQQQVHWITAKGLAFCK